MLIREAVANDFDGIRLYAQLNPDDPVVTDGRDRTVFQTIVNSDHLRLFVGEMDGTLVTTCYLNFIPNMTRNVSPYCVIENVVTEQARRNQGLGKTLIKYVLDFAWAQGCYKVMLQTGSKRESTHNFYKSCGFRADDKFAFVARPE
ncbi:MAG: GNAT family N-acetyltransferase [Proteobacteria bacterium]|nr:GNAT family N-acetyltransferase [Pseudomonadota bacterium]MDA1301340.1 GNAT family N-acetyltransferase [Pseudomonadota bacterium]